MRLALTLDTNAILDLADERADAPHVWRLVELHRCGAIELAITGISAAERQQGGRYIANFDEFQERLAALGLDDLTLLKPMGVYGVAFYGWATHATPEREALRDDLLAALWPELPSYRDYCATRGLDPAAEPMERQYKNKALDVLIMHTHIMNGRDVFVTRDDNFFTETKFPRLIELGANAILRPGEAVKFIEDAAG